VKIFDPLGREVATLLNERKDAGSYKVQINGSVLLLRYEIHQIPKLSL
jgi:hypothetical protein